MTPIRGWRYFCATPYVLPDANCSIPEIPHFAIHCKILEQDVSRAVPRRPICRPRSVHLGCPGMGPIRTPEMTHMAAKRVSDLGPKMDPKSTQIGPCKTWIQCVILWCNFGGPWPPRIRPLPNGSQNMSFWGPKHPHFGRCAVYLGVEGAKSEISALWTPRAKVPKNHYFLPSFGWKSSVFVDSTLFGHPKIDPFWTIFGPNLDQFL